MAMRDVRSAGSDCETSNLLDEAEGVGLPDISAGFSLLEPDLSGIEDVPAVYT